MALDKKPESNVLVVNKNGYLKALKKLQAYHGDLLGSLDYAMDAADQDWIDSLQEQIEIIDDIYQGLSNSVQGYVPTKGGAKLQ